MSLLTDLLNVTDDAPWMADAACRDADPDLFFIEHGGTTRPAKAICGTCNYTTQCLQYALDNDLVGVWGGTNDTDRKRIRHNAGVHACHLCSYQYKSRNALTSHLTRAHQALPMFCTRGHEWTEATTIRKTDGRRLCTLCGPPNQTGHNQNTKHKKAATA